MLRSGVFARHNVDEEVEHVALSQGACNVTTLQGASLILLCVDPCAHGQLCDEDVATLREQDWRLSRDHFNIRVGLHDFLDTRQRELMQLVVVFIGLELRDLLLPVRVENVAVVARQPLVDLL